MKKYIKLKKDGKLYWHIIEGNDKIQLLGAIDNYIKAASNQGYELVSVS